MKVLFISSWYPTENNPNFGIFVKEHAHAIQTTDNQIVVLSIIIHKTNANWNVQISDSLDEKGLRTVLIEINTKFRDVIYHAVPVQYLLLKRVFQKKIFPTFKPDIVHSNVIFPAGIIGNRLANFLKKPHVITEHWTNVKKFMKFPILSDWGRKTYLNATRILPVSNYLQQEIIKMLPEIDTKKFKVVGNVVDSTIFTFQEKSVSKEYLRLCSIATWMYLKNPAKQPELLINALSKLQKETKKTILLTMIGGGDKVNELADLCIQKGIKAEFTGYLPKDEIAKRLQSSDFYVHATTIETFGVVIAEALLCGTPVICSNVGALPELINKTNGILCENTIESWVNGLKSGISTLFNHAEIAENIQKKFSSTNIGIEIDTIYRSV